MKSWSGLGATGAARVCGAAVAFSVAVGAFGQAPSGGGGNEVPTPSPIARAPADPRKLIVTFSVSQWSCMPAAMERMAEVAHSEGVPVSWNLSFATAREEKAQLDDYHQRFGDEVIMIRGSESLEEWRKLLPWARLNMVHGARPDAAGLAKYEQEGIAGIWGYCDQQVGIDGITHWGCPWGIFPISKQTPFIPAAGAGTVMGAPWTLRDLHKVYHLGNAIWIQDCARVVLEGNTPAK